jgi:hypothetical protein
MAVFPLLKYSIDLVWMSIRAETPVEESVVRDGGPGERAGVGQLLKVLESFGFACEWRQAPCFGIAWVRAELGRDQSVDAGCGCGVHQADRKAGVGHGGSVDERVLALQGCFQGRSRFEIDHFHSGSRGVLRWGFSGEYGNIEAAGLHQSLQDVGAETAGCLPLGIC